MRSLLVCMVMAMLLCGCGQIGGGGGSSAAGVSGSGPGGGAGGAGDGGASKLYADPIRPHSPEPATCALLAGGLAAYLFLKRKK